MRSRKLIVACFLLAALVVPAVATASKCGAACDQYGEGYPTSGGAKVVGSGKTKAAKLPKATEKALKSANSRTQTEIRGVVTGPGAPTSKLPTVKNPDSSLFRSLGASIVSPASGSLARLAILLAAIIGTTVVVATTAVRKQRTQR